MAEKQKLSRARYVIGQMNTDQKNAIVWELMRSDSLAGRFLFEMVELQELGPATALDILLAIIKESQSDKYHRTM